VRRADTRESFETRISSVGVCDHNKEVCNQRVPLGFTSKREEWREGRERKGGGGARQAKLLIKTYSTSDPKVQLSIKGRKLTKQNKTKTIIQLQNQIKPNKSLKTKL
jgi:hypothetical protein